jgi:HK97 family phage prohead protease
MTPALEIRTVNGEYLLEGHASVFGRPYDVGSYREVVRTGAFRKTLRAEPDVTLLLNHDGLPLARTKSGTLDLREDSIGLHIKAHLDPSDPDVAQIKPKLARGDLAEMSFAFIAREQEWSDDLTERAIICADIDGGDVSIVTRGANPATSVTLRGRELTFEQRKAAVREVGDRVHGRLLLGRRGARGLLRSSVLAEPSPLASGTGLADYWQQLRDLQSGNRRSGDPVEDGRALLERGRPAVIRREPGDHATRAAWPDKKRELKRDEAERRYARWVSVRGDLD